MRRTFLAVSAVLLLVLWTRGPSLIAGQARQEPDVLGALLTEVRGLRAAMEAMAATGPRVQLAMGRLQLQEQRITTMVRRLDEIRDRRIASETDLDRAKRRLADLQEAIRQSGPGSDPGLDEERKAMQAQVAHFMSNLTRYQSEEGTLSQDLAAEQGRWSEINQRLEELDRALGRR